VDEKNLKGFWLIKGTSLFPGAYVKMDIVKELKIKRRV
jgi:hypothetical protein